MTNFISTLIESEHGAIYAYGVIAAHAAESSALDDMATHRQTRDELITYAQSHGIDIPPAQPAYQLPVPVRDEATARSAATAIENLLCANWAHALSNADAEFATTYLDFPAGCALRAFAYTQQYFAFPG